MVSWKKCWISKSGQHFDTQSEAIQHDAIVELIGELEEILGDKLHVVYNVRSNRKEIYECLKKYYEEVDE